MAKYVWVTYSCPVCHSWRRIRETGNTPSGFLNADCLSYKCKGKYSVSFIDWEGHKMEPVIKPWNKSEEVQAVECIVCQSLHKKTNDTYIKVQGNIYIGEDGGLVGNNIEHSEKFDPNASIKTVHSTIFCRKESCLKTILKDFLPDSVITFQDKPSFDLNEKVSHPLDAVYGNR